MTKAITPVHLRAVDAAEDPAAWVSEFKRAIAANPTAPAYVVPKEYLDRAIRDHATMREVARTFMGDVARDEEG